MMRPTVSVYSTQNADEVTGEMTLPTVFCTPLRQDIVSFVHDNLSRNSRQAHGVNTEAGMKHSAESWGTGRAVARIPRISGSGTHRSGQGAFGNMCRKGRMAFPLQTWRKWHRKVNLRQRRHALASAIAATGVPALVLARGHQVMKVPQLPLVVEDSVNGISKTKEALKMLDLLGATPDLERVANGKSLRSGKGKVRGKRYQKKKGPLFVVNDESESLMRALRNIPGVDVVNVTRLNIRLLAPGGQLGRFTVYTQSAMKELANQFGSFNGEAPAKRGYTLKREVLRNPDISSIINSDEIQSVLRNKKSNSVMHLRLKRNPLKNNKAMDRLNPYAKTMREQKHKRIQKKTDKKSKEMTKQFISKLSDQITDQQNKDQDYYKKTIEITKIN